MSIQPGLYAWEYYCDFEDDPDAIVRLKCGSQEDSCICVKCNGIYCKAHQDVHESICVGQNPWQRCLSNAQ